MSSASNAFPASFGDIEPMAGPAGQLAHPSAIEHLERIAPKLYEVGDHAWCVVGNGLSNQTFVEGPEGIIAIDTGDCVEEMAEAIRQLREVTDTPIVACIYTHFHYVDGTTAILADAGLAAEELPIWGHERIAANRLRFGGEVAGRSRRGLVHQFGMVLPSEGPDALLHAGLGRFFSNPAHRPSTRGHLPVTTSVGEHITTTIAGLDVEMTHAPSDSDDSLTVWFPSLGLCANNIVWPVLFNVFAIRGEEYRDPRTLLAGLDHVASLGAEHLVCTHGAPMSGAARIAEEVENYRDSIQFLWDQTVRGANNGLTTDELAERVQLPDRFADSTIARQYYGLVEHHVRQIHAGLFGWFDEDPAHLFPLPRADRAARLVAGFGGPDVVAEQCDAALADGDQRWALELATWLLAIDQDDDAGRSRTAAALRGIAQRTTSMNVRNWCLTKALEYEESVDLRRFYGLRIRVDEVLGASPEVFVAVMRVLLDPITAEGREQHLRFTFDDGTVCGLHMRRCVAVPTDGADADVAISLSHHTWAQILGGKQALGDAIEAGRVEVEGNRSEVEAFFGCFDYPPFRG